MAQGLELSGANVSSLNAGGQPGLGGWVALNFGRTVSGPDRVLPSLSGAGGRASLDVLTAELAIQHGRQWYGVRGSAMMDDDIGSGSSVAELGVLYGRIKEGRWYHAAIGAGLGLIDVCEARVTQPLGVSYDRCDGARISAPITARLAFRPASGVALGTQSWGTSTAIRLCPAGPSF